MTTTPAIDQPIRAAVGWLEHGTKRDAVDYAKGYANKYFTAPEICWHAVCPLLGGWLFEVQEGGAGQSYLPAIAAALSSGVDQSWIPSGDRAYSIMLHDGRPACILLAEDLSKKLMANEESRLQPKGKMDRVVKRGSRILAMGAITFATGFLFLAGASGFHAASQVYAPKDRRLDLALLPHRQWNKVDRVPTTMFVEMLRLDKGSKDWATSLKPMLAAGGPRPGAPSPSQFPQTSPNAQPASIPAAPPRQAAPPPPPGGSPASPAAPLSTGSPPQPPAPGGSPSIPSPMSRSASSPPGMPPRATSPLPAQPVSSPAQPGDAPATMLQPPAPLGRLNGN